MADVTGSTPPSARALKLKERLLSSPYEIDIERAGFYTDVWKRTEGAPSCMRAALAFEETLRKMSINIDDDELLVGVKTAKRLAGVIPVERGDFNTVLELELDRLTSRERHPFLITADERRRLENDILPYWRGRTVRNRKIKSWKEEGISQTRFLGPLALYRVIRGTGLGTARKIGHQTMGGSLKAIPKIPRLLSELAGLQPNLALTVFDVQGHLVPGYSRVLEIGFNGIAEKALQELEELREDDREYAHRKDFLESIGTAVSAIRDYSNRYAELAVEMAAVADGSRRAELLDIAERCRRVPAEPPRTFMEAIQSLWMSQVVLSISYGMAAILSPGRVDQYLYPFYKADLEEGRVTREGALGVLEEYLVKLGTYLILLIAAGKNTASEMAVGSNTFTVGGLDRDGNDATNEISYLFLEAHDNMKALANNLSVRISDKTPREFLLRSCETYRSTSGLAFFNDDVIVSELTEDGYSTEDALDYSIVGCVEPTSTGNSFACTAGNDISLTGVLEMMLKRGRMLFSSGRVGAPTADPRSFSCFDDVKDAFAQQLSFNVEKLVRSVELLDRAYSEEFPCPPLSATLEGCIESGTDMTRGGAKYNFGSITGRGLGTVTNSLAAIRWAVFERKLLTMDELIGHLENNFRGAESVRRMLLVKAPKYGNDDGEIDEIAAWVSEVFCREVRKHRCGRGGFYRPGMFSYGVHVLDGLYLGATPDGRLAGEPVSNGISPVNGTELVGPTAVLQSAARAGSSPMSDGTALNMRFSPGLLESDESTGKLASLVKGYFALGGRHVQFNVVDNTTLKDAQKHPEKYPDLVVRVSGYCAYFTDLGTSIQNDIIARTNFEKL